jgi:hypothetical protein
LEGHPTSIHARAKLRILLGLTPRLVLLRHDEQSRSCSAQLTARLSTFSSQLHRRDFPGKQRKMSWRIHLKTSPTFALHMLFIHVTATPHKMKEALSWTHQTPTNPAGKSSVSSAIELLPSIHPQSDLRA